MTLIFVGFVVLLLCLLLLSRDGDHSRSSIDRARQASVDVNRAVLRGDKAEVHRLMNKSEQEAAKTFGSAAQPSWRDKIFTGPRGGRYRINQKGRKSYDVP